MRINPMVASATACISASLLACGAGLHAVVHKTDDLAPLGIAGLIFALGAQVFVRTLIGRK
jgi:hypothetical protein